MTEREKRKKLAIQEQVLEYLAIEETSRSIAPHYYVHSLSFSSSPLFYTNRGDKPFDSTINPGKYIFRQTANKYVLTVLNVQVRGC